MVKCPCDLVTSASQLCQKAPPVVVHVHDAAYSNNNNIIIKMKMYLLQKLYSIKYLHVAKVCDLQTLTLC